MTDDRSPAYPTIDNIQCMQCRRCAVSKACRYMAVIRFGPDEPPAIDAARCQRCRLCLGVCPTGALTWG